MHHQPEAFPQWTDVFGLFRMAVCRRIQKGCQNTFPRDGFRENAVILMAVGKPAAVIRLILACRAVLNRIDLGRNRQYFVSQQPGMPETAQQVGVGENRLARQKRLCFLVIFVFGNLPFFSGPDPEESNPSSGAVRRTGRQNRQSDTLRPDLWHRPTDRADR